MDTEKMKPVCVAAASCCITSNGGWANDARLHYLRVGRSGDDKNSRPDPADFVLACREGPQPVHVAATHWCGRYRIAEQLIGGADARNKQ